MADIYSGMGLIGCVYGMSDFLVAHCALGDERMTDAHEDKDKKMSSEEMDRLEGWRMNELQRRFIKSLLPNKRENKPPEVEE
ncbi:hypothetical protein EH228_18645 [Erwinia endophytica]|uniref:hypothetical protein n=1 Tax=Erwinia endophytica TaxID=1563158 RepID=UPI001265EBF2|nr:hypothetical protein [Erwinia endophytica]KAB8306304.1 hypothetical protein EH228_18645 [Erwinia endophytica]